MLPAAEVVRRFLIRKLECRMILPRGSLGNAFEFTCLPASPSPFKVPSRAGRGLGSGEYRRWKPPHPAPLPPKTGGEGDHRTR